MISRANVKIRPGVFSYVKRGAGTAGSAAIVYSVSVFRTTHKPVVGNKSLRAYVGGKPLPVGTVIRGSGTVARAAAIKIFRPENIL